MIKRNVCTVSDLVFSLRSEYLSLEKQLVGMRNQVGLEKGIDDVSFFITENWDENRPEMYFKYSRVILKKNLLGLKQEKRTIESCVRIEEENGHYVFPHDLGYEHRSFSKIMSEVMSLPFVNNVSWSLCGDSNRGCNPYKYSLDIQPNGVWVKYSDGQSNFLTCYSPENDEIICKSQSTINSKEVVQKSLDIEIPLGILPGYHQALLDDSVTDNYGLILKDSKRDFANYGIVKH